VLFKPCCPSSIVSVFFCYVVCMYVCMYVCVYSLHLTGDGQVELISLDQPIFGVCTCYPPVY